MTRPEGTPNSEQRSFLGRSTQGALHGGSTYGASKGKSAQGGRMQGGSVQGGSVQGKSTKDGLFRGMPSQWIKLLLLLLLGLLAAASFVYNQTLIRELNEKERNAVELWAKALEFSNDPANVATSSDVGEDAAQQFIIEELIVGTSSEIPTIVTDSAGVIIQFRFLEEEEVQPGLIGDYEALNEPITITFGEGEQRQTQYIYFGESDTIRFLRYVPFIQFSLLALLIGLGVVTFRSISRSEQSSLWVGMAKEAAHQLGTPLSSLYGWIQLLKDSSRGDDVSYQYIYEAENDVSRIEAVAERFNKIGSSAELKLMRPEPIIRRVVEYMERRIPQFGQEILLETDLKITRPAALNAQLFEWALENLIKNAIDALPAGAGSKGDTSEGATSVGATSAGATSAGATSVGITSAGATSTRATSARATDTPQKRITIEATEQNDRLIIDITDNGSGIPKSAVSQVFKPGYSTKKRGWGLGLSLTRRIIETYHNGKISIYKTAPGQGTTFRIQIPLPAQKVSHQPD